MRLCLKLAARVAPRREAVKFRARLLRPSRRREGGMLRRPVGAAPSAAWGQGAGRMDTSNPIRIVLLFFALAAAAGAMVFMVFLELLPESCESASRSSVGLLVSLTLGAMILFQGFL